MASGIGTYRSNICVRLFPEGRITFIILPILSSRTEQHRIYRQEMLMDRSLNVDVWIGANCIYPIIGHTEYGWTFVGTDIDPVSIENARKIVTCNPVLAHKIDLRLQKDSKKIFDGIIMPDEYFDVTICNPPFHSSREEAEDGTLRKLSSLKGTKINKVQLNFGGSANELWCEGGEVRFLLNMISESQKYQKNCGWFTSLVSKEKNLEKLYTKLKSVNVSEYKVIRMQQGTKSSRILAWRFATNS